MPEKFHSLWAFFPQFLEQIILRFHTKGICYAQLFTIYFPPIIAKLIRAETLVCNFISQRNKVSGINVRDRTMIKKMFLNKYFGRKSGSFSNRRK